MARAKAQAGASAKRAPKKTVLVVSGPNLDRLGKREPEIYGRQGLAEIHEGLERVARGHGFAVDCRQSNHEGDLVSWIGEAADRGYSGILINPGAYTHTSYAIYDAIKGAGLPTIEIHLSNPHAREPFRHESRVAPACVGTVAGFGAASYVLGLEGLIARLGSS